MWCMHNISRMEAEYMHTSLTDHVLAVDVV